MHPHEDPPDLTAFGHKVLLVVWVGVAVAAVFLLRHLVLMVFLAILVALFWSSLTTLLEARLPRLVPRLAVLLVVATGTLGMFVVVGALLAAPIREQATAFVEELPRLLDQLARRLEPLAERAGVPYPAREDLDLRALLREGAGVLQTGVRGIVGLLTVLFLALFLSLHPNLYRRGFLRLVGPARRPEVEAVLDALTRDLRQWMKATGMTILFVGILTTLSLWIIGIPYALLFGVAAAMLELVPFIGPFLGFLGPFVLAVSIGWSHAVWVLVAWSVVQVLEGNVILPAFLESEVHLPPALTLVTLVAMGELFGFIGVLLAAPTLTVAMRLAKHALARRETARAARW